MARHQLADLAYGPDGYFFLYDYDGTVLMHPRQPELVGKNLLEMRDSGGLPAIRMLIDKARSRRRLRHLQLAEAVDAGAGAEARPT